MFLLVASHVLLTQGQFRLQALQRQADEQQARYERLRLEVARLESPERIVAVAQQRLGMVPPPGVKYLSPTGAATRTAPATGAGRQLASSPSASDWSAVKRRLASQP
jgi:cell division protein FtsL